MSKRDRFRESFSDPVSLRTTRFLAAKRNATRRFQRRLELKGQGYCYPHRGMSFAIVGVMKARRTIRETTRQGQALRLLKEAFISLQWRYGLFVFAVILFGLASLLPPQLYRYFTVAVTSLRQTDAQEFLIQFAIFGCLVALGLLIATVGNALCCGVLRPPGLEAELRRRVIQRLHQIPLGVLDGAQRGDWLTRMTSDLSEAESFMTESVPAQIRDIAVLLGAGALFVYYSGPLALFPMATAALLAVINLLVQRKPDSRSHRA